MLEQVLRELQPLCTSEQQFLQEFFQLGRESAELQVKVRPSPLQPHYPAQHIRGVPELSWALIPQEPAGGKLQRRIKWNLIHSSRKIRALQALNKKEAAEINPEFIFLAEGEQTNKSSFSVFRWD